VRVFFSTTGNVDFAPTVTWPNETLAGLATKLSLVAPVPPTPNRKLLLVALLVNVIPASTHPEAVGENVTFNKTLCPADSVAGKVSPDALKRVPLLLMAVTVTLVDPLLVSTASSLSLCPITTLPNCRLLGETVSCRAPALTDRGIDTANAVTVRKRKTRVSKD
jgi:hypothetical protein